MTIRRLLTSCATSVALMALVALAPALAQTPAAAEDPMPGGTLHLVAPFGTALTSLDPHKTYESQDLVVSKAFHRSLYDWDAAGNKPVLELASSVEVSPDGRTFTYRLLDNVFFHNGRRMTADDVIWSLTRVADPATQSPGVVNVEPIAGARDVIEGKASAVLAASIFHYGTFSIAEAKAHMAKAGIPVRLDGGYA
jgi:peptide/nickel transport system substrate-binding protein